MSKLPAVLRILVESVQKLIPKLSEERKTYTSLQLAKQDLAVNIDAARARLDGLLAQDAQVTEQMDASSRIIGLMEADLLAFLENIGFAANHAGVPAPLLCVECGSPESSTTADGTVRCAAHKGFAPLPLPDFGLPKVKDAGDSMRDVMNAVNAERDGTARMVQPAETTVHDGPDKEDGAPGAPFRSDES